ncbi:MAG: class I SAM-dependent methyltransferase [Actinomycetota bacterium]|nr:class I SAM-dependent methyltransferase [Actinomycetota bacterium]
MTDFDVSYFERLEAARRHWWVRGMQEVAAALLGDIAPGLPVLDAGCGTGAMLPWLSRIAQPTPVIAFDVAPAAIARCRQLGLDVHLALASVLSPPYRDASFDLVVSMDVLQHLTTEAAAAALAEMRRVLRPGGRLLVRTNAAFGRSHVEERDDWRLYRPESLREALRGAHFDVETLTPANSLQALWASIPRPGQRSHACRHGNGPHGAQAGVRGPERSVAGLGIPTPVSPLKNRLLLTVLQAEARWLARPGRRLPFGHSLYAVARRPAER